MSAAPAWRLGDIVWPTSIKLPVEPTHRQALALSMDWKREALFGDAAGGGKSVYLLLAALQLVDFKEYRALILRRTFPQLKIALGLLELANEWLSGQAIGAESRDVGLGDHVLYFTAGGLRVAMVVSAVVDVETFDGDKIISAGEAGLPRRPFLGAYDLGGSIVRILEPAALLPDIAGGAQDVGGGE